MTGKLLGITVPKTDILKPYDDLLAVIILLVQCYCQVKLTQAAISCFSLENVQIPGFFHASLSLVPICY